MNIFTKSLIAISIIQFVVLFMTTGKIESLTLEIGSLKAGLTFAMSEVEKQKQLVVNEYAANQANKLIINELNKELTDAKIALHTSKRGTATIGN